MCSPHPKFSKTLLNYKSYLEYDVLNVSYAIRENCHQMKEDLVPKGHGRQDFMFKMMLPRPQFSIHFLYVRLANQVQVQDRKDKTKMQHLNERVQCLFMDILTQKIHKLICFEDILIQLPVFGYESESLTSIIRNKIVEKSSSLSFRSKNSAN